MVLDMKRLVAEMRSQVPAVTPQQARGLGDLILDAREPTEFGSNGHIEGALSIPRDVLEAHTDPGTSMAYEELTRLRGLGRIHILCGSGARAAFAAHTLGCFGYDTTVIEGGIAAWKQTGLPVLS